MNTTRERIRQEAAEADRLIEQLRSNPELLQDTAPTVADLAAPPGDAPPSDPPSDPPSAPAPSPIEQQLAELEQRYRSLQGNFGTVNAQLQAANENNARILRMMELREQATAPASASASAAPVAAPAAQGLSEEERTELGPEFVAILERLVAGGVQAGLSQFDVRLTAIEGQLQQVGQQATYAANTVAKSEEQEFYEALAKAVPDFEAVNADPRFLTWLAHRDTFSGEVRKVLLERAASALDAPRTIAFFEAYLRETGQQVGTAPNGAETRQPTVDLATLVTPAPVAGAPDPNEAPSGHRIWTQAEVDRFYRDRMRGLVNDADFARLDAEILRALGEGRIRG